MNRLVSLSVVRVVSKVQWSSWCCQSLWRTVKGTSFQPICQTREYNSSSTAQWNQSETNFTVKGSVGIVGEEIYQQAMQAMENIQEIRKRKDDERSSKMYQAWEKAKDAEKSPKAQGIKVVKTLVKETRKEMDKQQQQDDDEGKAYQHAMDLLEQAALQHHHPLALVQLGNMALEKAGSAELRKMPDKRRDEIDRAIDLFQRAGIAGSRVGWYNLGHLFWTGYPVLEVEENENEDEDENNQDVSIQQEEQILQPDQHEAMDAFGKAIDLGDHDAMYLVGVHRMTAGGRENAHSGLKLVQRAGEGGHGGALYYLALFHLNGEPVIGLDPCSEEEFMQHLDRAVDAGSVDAMFTRGHSYYHGTEGYPQNFQRALKDFLQAAEEGHADSAVSGEYNILIHLVIGKAVLTNKLYSSYSTVAGAMLHAGIGVPKDQERAFELYQTAGELGSIEGWKNVVACYVTGEGVPQSLETAQYISDTMLKNESTSSDPKTI